MRMVQGFWKCLALMAWLGIGGMLLPAARAFDTGHHSDLTRSALQEEGFNDTAIKAAQLENWLTDYYSNTPTASVNANIKQVKSDMEKLHFDNLYSTAQIHNYWGHLTRNSHNAIQDAARQNDPLKALTLLGVSLHAVQDFYSHSNWVETHPRSGDGYRADTYFDSPPAADADLFTGYYPEPKPAAAREPHGNYDTGLNHDSYVRPRWDEAYVFAYAASRQWTAAMHAWADEVDPKFWGTMQNFAASGQNSADLDRDIVAAYRISEWVRSTEANGHWKGSGSGSASDFVPFSAKWIAQHDSIYVDSFKNHHNYAPLIQGLVGNDALRGGAQISAAAGPEPTIPRAQFSQSAVIVRTLRVTEPPLSFFHRMDKIHPLFGKPDFYAKISVAGQTFVEAMQLDQTTITPMWTTIRFMPTNAAVPIVYQLWDDDSVAGISNNDNHIDINPKDNQRDLTFDYDPGSHNCTGDVSGVHDSEAKPAISEGSEKKRANLRFYVTTRALAASPAQ